ncbi:hypothetical protein ACJMK2_031961 [Sinanodonta woodiana]|uniref:Uncharacterized protein n=1 Tax=Sinanodonta woodiana TaxID=1069815 RepID=A0ABD3X0C0_SINWO
MATNITMDTLLHKLEEIPCSFTLKIKGLTQRQAKELLNKLQREYECQEYDYPEEQRRYFNLMTYLHYVCRQLKEASSCNKEALKMDPECIVSLANQAWISYLERSRYEDCQEIETIISKASILSLNRIKHIEARAEIAYSYARFGIKYYKEAAKWYQHVLDEVKENDKVSSFLWQYGYGLLIRRNLRFHGKGKEYEIEVQRAADLLYNVAKQDYTFRFKARAWAELGNLSYLVKRYRKNWQKFFPKEIQHLCEDDMFLIAAENIKKVNDIPALEHYANFLKRRLQNKECAQILQQSVLVKETSRAYQWLAQHKMTMFLHKMKRMNKGRKEERPACIDYCEEVREILSDYDSAIKLQQNYAAMECKGKFLYHIGQFKDAIDVFQNIHSLLQSTDTQPERFDRIIRVFCQIYHAKCLVGLSRDASSIIQAKDLFRTAIEMSFDLQRTRLAEIEFESYRITSNDDYIRRDDDKLPRMTELQTVAIEEMKLILHDGEQTKESMFEELALCKLVKDEDRVIELCTEITATGIDPETQIDIAKELIQCKDFDKGLFLLKQLIICDQLPMQAKSFAIRAQVDGAMKSLIENDYILTGTRLRDAFYVRFLDQVPTDRDMLHVIFVAHECNKDITWKLQQAFEELTKLNSTSCFDATPGTSKLDNLEDNLQKCYVIAVLMDITDLIIDDIETDVFKKSIRMAQCTQMKHNRSKSLVAIQLSEQVEISSILPDARHVQLGNEFQQNKTIFLHDFFLQALLN